MRITRRIDWLQYTHHEIENWQARLPFARFDEIGQAIKPLARYCRAFELFGGGRVDISDDSHQGVQVTLGGAALSEWNVNGVSFQNMINQAVMFGKVVRLDFATDCREDGTSDLCLWEKVEHAALSGNYRSRLKAGVRIKDLNQGGFSQYFGSYKSDQFIRVYDKATESGLLKEAMATGGLLPVWSRVELVTKRDFAHNLASDMAYKGWQQVGAAKLRSMIDFPDMDGWIDVVDGISVELTKVGRKPNKWRKWMDTQVLPSILEHAKDKDDKEFIIRWLQVAVNNVFDES